MALTPEQKEANRIARNARDRAHSARRRLRDKAEKTAKDAVMAEITPEHTEAKAAENAVEAEREAYLQEHRRRVATLELERDAAMTVFRERWYAAHDVASAIWNRKIAADRAIDRQLDEEFPDLKGHARWSAACWTSPAETTSVSP